MKQTVCLKPAFLHVLRWHQPGLKDVRVNNDEVILITTNDEEMVIREYKHHSPTRRHLQLWEDLVAASPDSSPKAVISEPGEISETPVMVWTDGLYLYLSDTLPGLIHQMAFEWKADKHLASMG